MTQPIKTVTTLEVTEYKLDCPYCGETETGFCGDSRGDDVECDSCNKIYIIHPEADFEVY